MRGAGFFALLAVLALGAAPLAAQELPAPDPLAIDPPGAGAPPENGRSGDLPTRTIRTPDDRPDAVVAPVLTVDQDALFARSAWGRRVQAELDEEGSKIAAENERLANQLAAEEADLTERRKDLDPAEFRRLAEAFDTRATNVRRERAQVVQELNARAEADRDAFYQAALPVMGELMTSRGAVAVLDRRTVFVSLDAIDVTDDLIELLDETLSDGAGRAGTMGATDPDRQFDDTQPEDGPPEPAPAE
ncbi:OmpH family outer membrane protein [Paracoccus siganidrum]|nr:OmpH family outer membrane protein [Paracoccus siganidrum]RMC40594.1 OmpH family outer membrane protein [Paracoccus siganidrum]